ncbi:MAG: quinolinate synthase NadA [Pseudomonadota bacterium]
MEAERLKREIRRLARERHAVILVHNYQMPEIHDVADLAGDSLDLSLKAAATDARVVVFCGVNFMAETAAVLCSDKQVILAHEAAGCPMADSITAERLLARKEELGGPPVVAYVNTTAEVKAESDVCCTSANVVRVINSLEGFFRVLAVPDRNLAEYARRHTEKEVLLWPGVCPIHDGLTADDVEEVKARHPGALFVAHPECRPEVLDLADAIRSTTGMLVFCRKSPARMFIIGTEEGLLYPLRRKNPGKIFVSASPRLVCPDMKRTRLTDVIAALEGARAQVRVPEATASRARLAIERMLALPRDY